MPASTGSPSTASRTGLAPARVRCSARMVVKVAGMCWVIRTGALSVTASSRDTSLVSACGPPVEAPISSTRGGIGENGRSLNSAGSGSAPAVRHLTVRCTAPPSLPQSPD